MPKIFISHRGGDSGFAAVLIDQLLRQRFGPDEVFREYRSITPGQEFVDSIKVILDEAPVVLAIIGPDWLTAKDENGIRALDRRSDYLRRELEAAGQAGRVIVPVLLDNTPMPSTADLPATLTGLAERQFLRLSTTNVEADGARLVNTVSALLDEEMEPALEGDTAMDDARQLVAVGAELENGSEGPTARIRRADVPAGPVKELFDRLHRLHRWAGEPSMRSVANGIGQGVISYGTVYSAFRGPRVPRWNYLELIVEALDGDVDVFHDLWVLARDAEDRATSGEADVKS
ncbi:toll/interleukin-1 receptor domain-containing protein [Streptomyces sp. Lzd4kr]|nr:toll/interleukin-1 receptor domain-containing protein [Streptomyces sp. Lzd4kr]